jgi:PAS domain S-box-containing protein
VPPLEPSSHPPSQAGVNGSAVRIPPPFADSWGARELAVTLDSVGTGVWAIDLEGRCVFINQAACRTLAYRREECLGEKIQCKIHAGHRRGWVCPKDACRVQTALHSGSAVYVDDDVFRRRDGASIAVKYSIQPVVVEGRMRGSVIAMTDISARKSMAEALEIHVEKLARSNAELERFAYVASHDLQEPLRMVASFTQLLAKRYSGRLDETADRYIDFAVDGARRMQQLIVDLLAYSRVNSQELDLRQTECEAVVQTVLRNLSAAIDESGAVIERDPLPVLTADAAQLGQLFQNLIGNAIKFRGPAPLRIRIAAADNGPHWLFSVQDNGIGIDPRHSGRIFQIFQRLHTREAYPGTGIGLAVCQKVAERHGGKIWVESEPGLGSTFRFTIRKPGVSE